jgi:hypothetical protein
VPDRTARPAATIVAAVAFLALAAAVAGCSSGRSTRASAPVAAGARPEVLVTVGGVETSNVDFRTDRRDTWPQIVLTDGLPAAAVLVDLAGDDVTAAGAVDDQLPSLASLHPDAVTIWVESADVRRATSPATYRAELSQLVEAARRAGASKVLLLTPPASESNLSGGLAATVAEVAAGSGATLVRLGDTSDRYSDQGQRQIADAVIAALR